MSNMHEQSILIHVSTTFAKFIWQIKLIFNTSPQSTKLPTSSQNPSLLPSTLKPSNSSNSFNFLLSAGSEINYVDLLSSLQTLHHLHFHFCFYFCLLLDFWIHGFTLSKTETAC